jgi:catechol 2,3-dioxygenase
MKPQLAHVGIYVTDAENMIRFYGDVLGLTVTDRGISSSTRSPIIFMSSNPTQHHQFVIVQGRDKASTSTINQLSFKVDTLNELREVAAKATAKGAKLRQTSHGNAWSVYFPDPEGNQVEVYLDTPWHVAQPHGDPMDFSLSDEEIYAQTEKIVRADPTFKLKDSREAELARILSHS